MALREGMKLLIHVNAEGILVVPSRNEWHATLKHHACELFDVAKSIGLQDVEKIKKMKECLEKQFDYTELGLKYSTCDS